MTNKEIALQYAKRYGFRVFPCGVGEKIPACPHGFKDATTDPAEIEKLWTDPDFNIGIATGLLPSGKYLTVFDQDTKNEGERGWAALCARLSINPEPFVETGTGGRHYFTLSDIETRNTESVLAPGVDTRGEGGYVVAAPSRHPNGNRYRWLRLPKDIPMTPKSLLDLLTVKKGQKTPKATGQNMTALRKAQSGVNHFASLPERISKGTRNGTIAHYAYGLVHSYAPDEVEQMVSEANDKRCEPPLPIQEIRRILESAEKKRPADWNPNLEPLRNYRIEQREVKVKTEDGEEKTEPKEIKIPLVKYSEDLREQAQYFYKLVDTDEQGEMYLDNQYRQGGDAIKWQGKIETKYHLHGALAVLGRRIDFLPAHEGGKISEEDYLAWLRENCRAYHRIKVCPEFPADPDTLYIAGTLEPRRTGKLRELCETFTTADTRSQYRVCAGILSSFLPRNFDGGKPLLPVVGPEQDSGKTTLVNVCSEVVSGLPPVKYKPRSNRNADTFGDKWSIGNPVVLMDNMTSMRQDETASIADDITSRTIQTHRMYVSHGFFPNHYTWWATINDEHFLTTDLLHRSVIINMRDWRSFSRAEEVEGRKGVSEKLERLKAHRADILADIAWTFQEANKLTEEVPYIPQRKFSLWSAAMARLLRVVFPEIDCFDFSVSEEEEKHFDPDIALFESVYEYLLENDSADHWHQGDRVLEAFQKEASGEPWTRSKRLLSRRINSMAKKLPGWRVKSKRRETAGMKDTGWTIERVQTDTKAETTTTAQSVMPTAAEPPEATSQSNRDLEPLFTGARADLERLKAHGKNGNGQRQATDWTHWKQAIDH